MQFCAKELRELTSITDSDKKEVMKNFIAVI
jgi:hypothetical protein